MSILFNAMQASGFKSLDEDATLEKIAQSRANGEQPRPLTFDEFFHMTSDEHNALAGCMIEINSNYSLDEMASLGAAGVRLKSIENLDLTVNPYTYDKIYGKKWRVWVDGFPTPELMAATPWEED